MRSAFESSKTGALISEAGEAKRLIFFADGELVGVRSNVTEERLGEVMVREHQITEAELEHAIAFIRTGRKLGQILVELGYLKGGEIERFVRIQILDIACAILTASSDRLVFSEQVEVEAVTLSPVSIGDVFLHAVKQLPDVTLYRENVLIADYVLEQTSDALAIVAGMELSTEQATLLDLVNGDNRVGDILEKSPLDEEQAVRTLIAIHQAGVVTLKERKLVAEPPLGPRPSPRDVAPDPFEKELIQLHNDVQCQNHWQVLGLTRGATHSEIEAAYAARFHRLDPEKWEHIPDTDFQEKLAWVRSRIKEAYVTLSSQTSTHVYEKLDRRESQYQESREKWDVIETEPTVLEDWDRCLDPEEAARLFKRAKRAMKEQDFWSAIELCRRAIELDEENQPERYHLLGRALSENPRWRRDAETNLKIAHKLEPWEPRYLVSLGQLYQREGLTERAERTFAQVRTLDPDCSMPEALEADNKPDKRTEDKQKAG
jgi:tetratricopeptide (TPR) repeat protein